MGWGVGGREVFCAPRDGRIVFVVDGKNLMSWRLPVRMRQGKSGKSGKRACDSMMRHLKVRYLGTVC